MATGVIFDEKKPQVTPPNWEELLPAAKIPEAEQNQEPLPGPVGDGGAAEVQQPAQPEVAAAPQQTVQQPVQQPAVAAAQQQAVQQPQQMSYEDMLRRLEQSYPQESDKDKEKRIKRERAGAVISAIGDGISALSNMYATTKGAQSAINANTPTLSEKYQERMERLRKLREEAA